MQKTSPPFGVTRTVVRTRKQVSVSPNVVSTPPVSEKRNALPAASLSALIDSFLIAGDIERHSQRTLDSRRERLSRLVWVAERKEWTQIGFRELQGFFLYLNHSHKEPGGRWGNPHQTKPLSSGRVKSYHSTLRTFFRWLVTEGELDICPMDKIPVPVDRPDQIQPFTDSQINALLAATKKTSNPHRDEAIIYVLIDTGLRVSELTALTIADVNFNRAEITIKEGKGGKARYVPFGRNCKRSICQYLQMDRRRADLSEPLFLSDRGPGAGAGFLTARAIALLLSRLGTKAQVSGVRCSPHTCRHYFAVSFLRNGGNVFALKAALGHESLTMTNRYVALATADLAAAHRLSSPGDRLKSRKEGKS